MQSRRAEKEKRTVVMKKKRPEWDRIKQQRITVTFFFHVYSFLFTPLLVRKQKYEGHFQKEQMQTFQHI